MMQSDCGDVSDLQSLLGKIQLEGSTNDSGAVDQVANNLRARLNISVEDEGIFQRLASQLLQVNISGAGKEFGGDRGTSCAHYPTELSSSSPALKEPELQSTWSTDTSSSANTQQPVARDTNIPAFNDGRIDPSTPIEQNSTWETSINGQLRRGRSPSIENRHEALSQACTNNSDDISAGRTFSATSNYMMKQHVAAPNSNGRRSPSPFRLGILFPRRGRKTEGEIPAGSPPLPGPLRTRSFEKCSAAVSGATPPKPPMSPFPPSTSVDMSFGSSLPPTPHISYGGLNNGSFDTVMSSPSINTASVPTPIPPQPPCSVSHRNDNLADRSNRTPQQPRATRGRTPTRYDDGTKVAPQSRSQSLPRTSKNSRSPRFQNFSPGRLFGRPKSQDATSPETPPIAFDKEPKVQSLCPQPLLRGRGAPEWSSIPKSSPLKTPATRLGVSVLEFETAQHKHRRKMENEMNDAATAATKSNATFGSHESTTKEKESNLFQVNLAAVAVKGLKTRSKNPSGAIRRNIGVASLTQTPTVLNRPNKAELPAERNPSPMETEMVNGFQEIGLPIGAPVPPPVVSAVSSDEIKFSIGGSDHGCTKSARRHPKRQSHRARAHSRNNSNQQTSENFPSSSASAHQSIPTSIPQGVPAPTKLQGHVLHDLTRIEASITSLRDEARKFYQAHDYRASILRYTLAIKTFTTLPICHGKPNLLANLLSDRAAALVMIGATSGSIHDCKRALNCLQRPAPPSYVLTERSDPLEANIYNCMAKASFKDGNIEGAMSGFMMASQVGNEIMTRCQGSSLSSEQKQRLQSLVEANNFEQMQISKFQALTQKIAGSKMPSLQAGSEDRASLNDRKGYVDVLDTVKDALSMAPRCIGLHGKKVALLAALRRWREVASHCERLAASNVQLDEVFTEDLEPFKPFRNAAPAKFLTANFFGDPEKEDFNVKDYAAAELKLTAKATAEAALRMPPSLLSTYLRALRLEERYPASEAAINALVGCTGMDWLPHEEDRLIRTKKSRERGDELFRLGNYEGAVQQYATCLKIDSENTGTAGAGGGRLHAVLHCNRAARFVDSLSLPWPMVSFSLSVPLKSFCFFAFFQSYCPSKI